MRKYEKTKQFLANKISFSFDYIKEYLLSTGYELGALEHWSGDSGNFNIYCFWYKNDVYVRIKEVDNKFIDFHIEEIWN